LTNAEGIEFVNLDNRDVLRHKLVRRLIEIYGQHGDKNESTDRNKL
ncbi:MAG: hypothetical protein RL007_1714, partial [Bacteroidota bacterium]